jgi:hypothetical protein
MPSLPPSLMAPAWDFASAGQSLSRMAGTCGPLAPPGAAQPFSSPCPPRSRPIHNSRWPLRRKIPVKEKENLSPAAVYEFASVTSACDELDISRLSPTACVVGLGIDLRSRKSPSQFHPPSQSLRWAGLPLELSRRTDGNALPQEATASCLLTSEQWYWHTLRWQPASSCCESGPASLPPFSLGSSAWNASAPTDIFWANLIDPEFT